MTSKATTQRQQAQGYRHSGLAPRCSNCGKRQEYRRFDFKCSLGGFPVAWTGWCPSHTFGPEQKPETH